MKKLYVNGEEIDEDVLEGEFRQVKGHYERMLQVACCERDPEFWGYARDNVVSRVLLAQEGVRRFPVVTDEEVRERLDKLIAEAGGEQQFYLNIGLPMKDEAVIRPNVENGVRLDKMLAEVYDPEPEFAEEEMRAWYEDHVERFLTAEEIRAAHITKNLQGAQSRDEVFAEMRALRKRLMAGEDFMAMAEQERAAEQQQIDLGWFKRGEFMEEFEVIAFSMEVGEISPVFTTQLGLHLCTVLERRLPEPKGFEVVRDEVRARMLDGHRDTRFNAFLEELKAKAEIREEGDD
jgi:parvulin-like peptidyl-prolyl isomerase